MSEFRQDTVSGRWVIVAPERAARPTDFPLQHRHSSGGGFCPFCEGNEDKTPPEITSLREPATEPDMPGWQVRVVPNRFPALRPEGTTERRGGTLFGCQDGLGLHEVIIESPSHIVSTAEMDLVALEQMMGVCRDRIQAASEDPRLAYAMLFKNVGAAAGATVEHSHSQLVVTPVIPPTVCDEMRGTRRHLEEHGTCLFCSMIDRETAEKTRIVFEGADFTAIAPFASCFPFETWILPRRHSSHFEKHSRETLGDLARVMYTVIAKLDTALSEPAYNYVVHTAPFGMKQAAEFHWHIEVIPRTTGVAGFEWGTGIYINPVPPEDAAAFLRESCPVAGRQ